MYRPFEQKTQEQFHQRLRPPQISPRHSPQRSLVDELVGEHVAARRRAFAPGCANALAASISMERKRQPTLRAGLVSVNLLLRQNGYHILQRALDAMLFAVQCANDGQIRSSLLRHSVRVNPSDRFGTDEFRSAFFSALELKESHSASIRAPAANRQAPRQCKCSTAPSV
jgi:hypothetical protein